MGIFSKAVSSKLRYTCNSYVSRCVRQQNYVQRPVLVAEDRNKLILVGRNTKENVYVSYLMTLSSLNGGRHFSLGKMKDFTATTEPFVIGSSCGGILLLEDALCQGKSFFWNPLTDEYMALPPSFSPRPGSAYSMQFAFSGIGLGAGPVDYKVVRVASFTEEDDDETYIETTKYFELYSLKNNSWRLVTQPSCGMFPNPLYNHLSLNGACHWVANGNGENMCILSFDFADETFSHLTLPSTSDNLLVQPLCLVNYDGLLGVVVMWEDMMRLEVLVWAEGGWTKVWCFDVSGVQCPLGIWGRDKCFLRGTGGELLLFDGATGVLGPVDVGDDIDAIFLLPYVESEATVNEHRGPHLEVNLCNLKIFDSNRRGL
ncbi:Unknown protein [Striga hermonthica]|uniref:F-box associated beta-propeller type 1 domain-containing protein n=1 Tax=Striga hermonthica TaxID=68872 RepID=A0A9N7NB91_STRHE|nr:Unknown protein [Striga hermonthica]